MLSNEKDMWLQAMEEEIGSIKGHGVYLLTKREKGMKVLPNRWVYVVKQDSSGKVERFKARLVVKGFFQKPGEDVLDTYAPVTSKSTFRALMAHAVKTQAHVRQLDVKTAFLYGNLEEVVHMEQPQGFEEGDPKQTVRVTTGAKSLAQEAEGSFGRHGIHHLRVRPSTLL